MDAYPLSRILFLFPLQRCRPLFSAVIINSILVPSYEIKYEFIIHSFKHIYHRGVLHRALICKASPIVPQLCTTRTVSYENTTTLGSVFNGASTDKSGS